MTRSANPALRSKAFKEVFGTAVSSDSMTLDGTVNKTGLMLFILIAGATLTWSNPQATSGWMMLGVIGGFITAMVTVFKMEWARYTAPLYALLEGFFIGGISSIFEAQYPGIVIQAVLLTFGTAAAMLFVYKTGIIKVTQKFRIGVIAATGGIFIAYFLSFILGFFGVHMNFLFGGGLFGIVFNLVVIGVAAMNLILDFDFIEEAAASNAPKYMEWYGAFGLMVTLVWLYIEFLRLLASLQRR
ncbi:MAG TPA: Bax inhibitor-1/YccA family protein [Balneolales bacterium]|nr:Bax inhibitor-1/YccA family protein [Balneolales bacterium]